MFTIPCVAGAVCACGMLFGTVDWSKSYSVNSFYLQNDTATMNLIGIDDENLHVRKGRGQLRKLIGNRAVACTAKMASAHTGWHGHCYLSTGANEYPDIAEEMHKRGF
jgi:hypothetical protein